MVSRRTGNVHSLFIMVESMNQGPPPPPPAGTYQSVQPGGTPGPYVAPPNDHQDPKGGSNWSGCLIGCLVTFGICCVLCAGTGYFVYSNASRWIISTARTGVQAMLEESELPREEQTAILDQFDRLTTAYQNGEVTLEELGPAFEELFKSPVIMSIMIKAIETKYLEPSGLSDEEKESGRRVLARVMRGIFEEKFQDDEITKLVNHFLQNPDHAPDEQPQMKQSLTDEELRDLLNDAQALVDEKEIPDQDYDVKISDAVKQIVDDVLEE